MAKSKVQAAHMVQVADEAIGCDHTFALKESSSFLCPEALGILDSGCQKTVSGLFPFRRWEESLQQQGLLHRQATRLESD